MSLTSAELKLLQLIDLKQLAKTVSAPHYGKKEEIIQRILKTESGAGMLQNLLATKKKEGKYCYETGLRAGQLAPLGHTSPARLTKVLEHLDKHPPPIVPEDALYAASEAVKQALKALDYDIIDLRLEGMMGLAEWISNAYGPPAEALGYELRNERLEETAPALTRMVKGLKAKVGDCRDCPQSTMALKLQASGAQSIPGPMTPQKGG